MDGFPSRHHAPDFPHGQAAVIGVRDSRTAAALDTMLQDSETRPKDDSVGNKRS